MARARKRTGPGPREAAIGALTAVLSQGRSLPGAITTAFRGLSPDSRSLAQEIAYGTLRWHPRLRAFLGRLMDRPLRRKDLDVEAALLAGLYQLEFTTSSPHTAVSASVSAVKGLGKSWAGGLVNAVLRRFLRQREELMAGLEGDEAAQYAHPPWLLQALKAAWPACWEAIASANNERPPMVLRVNRLHQPRSEYLLRLEEAGTAAEPMPHAAQAVVLDRPMGVGAVPGFGKGDASIQDAAAQLAPQLMRLEPGHRVLDACAAPGGKTGHILETCPDAALTAIDIDAGRLGQVRENLERLGLSAELVVGDASTPADWWDGEPYDRILLDAPCTGTGVIRRHPDIKVLRKPQDVAALARRQAVLLEALWPLLRQGGTLVYATCSVLPDENHGQIRRFLSDRDDAADVTPSVAWGHNTGVGRQILPGEDGMDGFYYACLEKR